jgi:hypothetical protein
MRRCVGAEGRLQESGGPLGSAGLGSVPAIVRGDAFGRPRGIDGTAGHDRATAVLLPKRLRCRARVGSTARYSADCAGLAGTENAVAVVPPGPLAASRDAAGRMPAGVGPKGVSLGSGSGSTVFRRLPPCAWRKRGRGASAPARPNGERHAVARVGEMVELVEAALQAP